jgi:hypothetical protein
MAAAYLISHESRLRARESSRFDDDQWYRFGRSQNIEKQSLSKICVASTVSRLQTFYDAFGGYFINNVRVNGVVPKEIEDGWYLLGVMNSTAADLYFRIIAKPKDNDYFEANKQFIAPIPIPDAPDEDRRSVIVLAKRLQELHTQALRERNAVERRLNSRAVSVVKHPLSWIMGTSNPQEQKDLEERIDRSARASVDLCPDLRDGELVLLADGTPVLDEVFVDSAESEWLLAQWRQKARSATKKVRSSPKKLLDEFRTLARTDNQALKAQIVDADRRLRTLETEIEEKETEIDETVMDLYGLDEDQKRLVRSRRS